MKIKLAEDGKQATTERRMALENGHPGLEVDEAAIRRGENVYTKVSFDPVLLIWYDAESGSTINNKASINCQPAK